MSCKSSLDSRLPSLRGWYDSDPLHPYMSVLQQACLRHRLRRSQALICKTINTYVCEWCIAVGLFATLPTLVADSYLQTSINIYVCIWCIAAGLFATPPTSVADSYLQTNKCIYTYVYGVLQQACLQHPYVCRRLVLANPNTYSVLQQACLQHHPGLSPTICFGTPPKFRRGSHRNNTRSGGGVVLPLEVIKQPRKQAHPKEPPTSSRMPLCLQTRWLPQPPETSRT